MDFGHIAKNVAHVTKAPGVRRGKRTVRKRARWSIDSSLVQMLVEMSMPSMYLSPQAQIRVQDQVVNMINAKDWDEDRIRDEIHAIALSQGNTL